MVLKEKYETDRGTVVFEAEGTDMEFVAVERNKMLWYLAVVDRVDDMGINPESIKPVDQDRL